MNEANKTYGQELDEWIRAEGLLRRVVAARAGIHPTALSHILSGRRAPTDAQRESIARVTGGRVCSHGGDVCPTCGRSGVSDG